jgi:hypothetical protein
VSGAPRRAGAATAITLAVLAAGTSGAPADGGRAEARAKGCGTYASTSIYDRAKVVAIRGVGCDKAKKVARRYDQKAKQTGPWRCALSHGGGRALFSCGHPATGGDLRDADHALKAKGVGQPG